MNTTVKAIAGVVLVGTGTLVAMAGAIAIIAAVTVILGLIPFEILERGIKIVFLLGFLMILPAFSNFFKW